MTVRLLGASLSRALLLLGLILIASAPVEAQGSNPYVVEGVEVDASAESSAQARDVALAEGQRRAFERLLQRLTLPVDHPKLPRPANVTPFVGGIEISKERSSATRYIATLSINFNRSAIRDLLRGQAIGFSEARSKPLVLLPIYRSAGGYLLWEDPNPWRAAWAAARMSADSAVPVIVPPGSAEDLAEVNGSVALDADRGRLAALARRYGGGDVMVAVAEFEASASQGGERLQVTLRRYGPAGPQVVVESVASQRTGAEAELIQRAIERTLLQIEEGWKRDTIIRFDQERQVALRAAVQSLNQWLAIRSALEAQSLVQRVEVTSMTTRSIHATVHYWGTVETLAAALAQNGVRMVENAGYWSVERIAAP